MDHTSLRCSRRTCSFNRRFTVSTTAMIESSRENAGFSAAPRLPGFLVGLGEGAAGGTTGGNRPGLGFAPGSVGGSLPPLTGDWGPFEATWKSGRERREGKRGG